MKDCLNGMYWTLSKFDFDIPFIEECDKSIFIFQKNLAEITWNCMRTLEQNPTTLPQTQTILKGHSVAGLSIDDLLQVKHYGDGAKELIRLLREKSFGIDEKTACAIHRYVGAEEALEWGIFRNLNIGIHDVEYIPPHFTKLHQLAEQGFGFLKHQVKNPKERAIALFLFMARTQFFFDANKRTASLMMNGCLMQNGFWPITVLNRDSEEFHEKLGRFYETGNADDMMQFFSGIVRNLYSPTKDPEIG